VIIGTAGHIDHGKTTLVRALTGVDTDRLPEEKRRGITIDLGFAPLELEGIGTVGVVDVPGHEAFVRTMVAGATGIDVALLVVAADEGIMPQTREHLAILTLLGIRAGVVALTKCDLVEPDWLDLVRSDVTEALVGSSLEGAALVATSARKETGVDEVRQALRQAVAQLPERDSRGAFRMPIDRAFSVKGTGTVVTGTVWEGKVAHGGTLIVHPSGRSVRVRGVQGHGRELAEALPGARTAIALAGVDTADIGRGAWLTDAPGWSPTHTLRAEAALLDSASHVVRPREWVRFHLGTADVGARLVAAGGPLAPGERRPVRVVLQEPVLARAGDRFVIRLASPARTIGGGVVVDPLPHARRVKPWAWESDTVKRLARALEESGAAGASRTELAVRSGLMVDEDLDSAIQGASAAEVSGRFYAPEVLREAGDRIVLLVNALHESSPLIAGAPIADCATASAVRPEVFDRVLAGLTASGRVERSDGLVRRPGWVPVLTPADRELRSTLLAEIQEAGAEPPDVASLTDLHHRDVVPFLRMLEREGLVVAVESDRYFSREAVDRLVGALRDGMEPGREYGPSELREIVGLSRKYLIPFLEFCDRRRITERRTTGRVLAGL